MSSLRVGLDVDGVIYDFISQMNEILGITTEPTCWDWFETAGVSQETFAKASESPAKRRNLFTGGSVCPGVSDLLESLYIRGCRIVIVTSRNYGPREEMLQLTQQLFLDHDLLYDEMYVLQDKTGAGCDTFLEDSTHFYDQLFRSSCRPFLLDRPWNQPPLIDYRRRVKGYDDFLAEVDWMIR